MGICKPPTSELVDRIDIFSRTYSVVSQELVAAESSLDTNVPCLLTQVIPSAVAAPAFGTGGADVSTAKLQCLMAATPVVQDGYQVQPTGTTKRYTVTGVKRIPNAERTDSQVLTLELDATSGAP